MSYQEKAAKISVIVCIKRHPTRMPLIAAGDKNGNALTGTVVKSSPKNDNCDPTPHPASASEQCYCFPADRVSPPGLQRKKHI